MDYKDDYKDDYNKLRKFINDLYPYMTDYCKEKVDGFFVEENEKKIFTKFKGYIQDDINALEYDDHKDDEDRDRLRVFKHFISWCEDREADCECEDREADCEQVNEYFKKQGEQNHAWSDDDEKMLNDAIGAVYAADYYTYDDKCEIESWLKSFKNRVQPKQKQEWSEDDEKMLKWLCRIVHSQRVNNVITLKEESELGQWMDKWLNHNPQSHWKPTEEQMHCFKCVIDFYKIKVNDNIVQNLLDSLYNDLKKL